MPRPAFLVDTLEGRPSVGGAAAPEKESPISAQQTSSASTRIRVLRTASLALAGVGAAITMSTLGSWFTPVILLVATVGALLVVWRTPGGAVPSRALIPVLVVVAGLTVAGVLAVSGVLPQEYVWAALGAYVVAWAEYLVSQTIARSRGVLPR